MAKLFTELGDKTMATPRLETSILLFGFDMHCGSWQSLVGVVRYALAGFADPAVDSDYSEWRVTVTYCHLATE